MLSKKILFILVLLCGAQTALSSSYDGAKALIIQISDTHSKLENVVQMLVNADRTAQDFLEQVPQGEVLFFFNGDVTGVNIFSEPDQGFKTLESLKLLRQRGYTVLFNIGNHDAFDWSSTEVNEAELMLEQLQMMHDWGVVLITSNFTKLSAPLNLILTPHYQISGLDEPTYLLGLTMETLLRKANLTHGNAPILFDKVLGYKKSILRSAMQLKKEGVKKANLIVGVHIGYKKTIDLAEKLRLWSESVGKAFKFPLLMAADDHVASASKAKKSGTIVSDAGSHGAFNTITLDAKGKVIDLKHHEVGDGQSDMRDFTYGSKTVQSAEEKIPDFLSEYAKEVEERVESVIAENSEPLMTITKDINVTKNDMKTGTSLYARMTPEMLVMWAREEKPQLEDEVVVAMSHSNSYKVKRRIKSGDTLTRIDLNEIYPFPLESSLFRLKGSEILRLFKSLKRSYARAYPKRYTPQLSLDLREAKKGGLEFYHRGSWHKFKPQETYFVAFDPWLSMNRFGDGPNVKAWGEVMSSRQPIMTSPHRDLISRYWTRVLEANDFGLRELSKTCKGILNP